MTIPNQITLEALVHLPAADLVSLPPEELARLQQEADAALRKARATVAWLDGALSLRYRDRAAAARGADGKDFGIARFDDGCVTVVAELPKKVEWKQDLLADIVDRIAADGEDPGEYVDVILKVAAAAPPARGRYLDRVHESGAASDTVQKGFP